jgi:PEP-CTERM motif
MGRRLGTAGARILKRGWTAAALGCCLALAWAAAAAAAPLTYTINNGLNGSPPTTLVESYKGASPTSFFDGTWGRYWGANIGTRNDPYQTTGATITWTGNTITFQFVTSVTSYEDASYAQPVYLADIFLKSGGGSSIPSDSQFNYAIALGATQGADGGLAAGLYQVTGEKTSQQIWTTSSGNDNITYGGQYASASNCQTGNTNANQTDCSGAQAAPVVVTSGTLASETGACAGLGGNADSLVVNSSFGTSDGENVFDVTLTANDAAGLCALEQVFGQNNDSFDLFWGTGDCSNAPIWGNVTMNENMVPEPGSMALLLSALLGFMLLSRRRRLPTRH